MQKIHLNHVEISKFANIYDKNTFDKHYNINYSPLAQSIFADNARTTVDETEQQTECEIPTLSSQRIISTSDDIDLSGLCYTPNKKPKLLTRVLQIGALGVLAIPIKGLMAVDVSTMIIPKFDSVIARQEIVVATVSNDSTLFDESEFRHGFGYDVMRRYADHLGVPMSVRVFADEKDMMFALKNGDVDVVLGTSNINNADFSTQLISCENDAIKEQLHKYGLNDQVGFTFLSQDVPLLEHSADFLCSHEQLAQHRKIAKFYDQTLLNDAYNDWHFKRAMSKQLPLYRHAFKMGAKQHDHDWHLLTAISYQESHLDPNAISFTGVQGLMMLTTDTAKQMGVKDRTDAIQSIQGGAKYLAKLEELFVDVPESERIWFVLASYNMGPNAIKRIQSQLNEQGKNAQSWTEVYGYLLDNADSNSRYVQCMHYVTNIRTYLEAIKEMDA